MILPTRMAPLPRSLAVTAALLPPGQLCHKGTFSSIAITLPAVASLGRAITGGQRKTSGRLSSGRLSSGRLYGYAHVPMASDANNLEIQRLALANCEQVFEGKGILAPLFRI